MKVKIFLSLSFINKILSPFFILNILIILFLTRELYSQSDSLIIEHITREQGLSNSSVYFINQDREGYLWFATEKGIERYDGYSFQSYISNPEDPKSFVNAPTYSIYIDKEDVIWVGTLHGLEKYNRSTNSFLNYLPDSSLKRIYRNNVYYMVEDNRDIFWTTTENGVFRFNKISGKFTQVQYQAGKRDSYNTTYYSQLYVDKDGSLWVGTGRGLDKFNYGTGRLFHYWRDPDNKEIITKPDSKYMINSICEDKKGILWLATRNGLVEFNKKNNTFTDYLPDPNLHSPLAVNILDVLFLDTSGLLWVGTNGGIFTFNTESKKFTPKFINKSVHNYYLGNNLINSLYIDRSGVLWVGTWSDGIYKVILKKLPYKRYFPGSVNQVVKGNNGILWVRRGVEGWVEFNTKSGQVTPLNFRKDHGIITDPDGNLYFKNSGSRIITKLKNGKRTNYDLLKLTSAVYFKSTLGMWYGAWTGGLYYIDFKTAKVTEVVKTGNYITTIFKDSNGLVWAATYLGRLVCYNPKNKSVSEFISDPQNPSSLMGREIFAIYQDKKGRLWFATDVGLNKYIPSTRTFIHFTEKDGLSGNSIYNILEDKHGNLWMGTDKGISRFNPETNRFKNFDVLKGLSLSHYYNHLAVKMDNGEMFFGRSYGLISFYPDSIKENRYVPPIVITSFRLFDKQVAFGKKINLTYDKNFLSFEFAALNYYNSQRNQYAYKMEGIDKDWIYSGTRRYASYPNMQPGKYIFRVKGSNNDGIWNEEGTSISIIISPPWWGTWWFKITSLIILFVVVGSTIRYIEMKKIKRKMELLEQERALGYERMRISRDMHDEIGSNLSEIAILSELAKKNRSDAEHHIQEISELTSEVIDSVSEIVWAINPQNDKLDNLIAHTRRYSVKYLGLANINCRFSSPDNIPPHPLSAEFRRNIFLIVKETLHNIVKHSCASDVLFSVNFPDNVLEMMIKDNGKGFSLEESQTYGNGLSNMKKRIEEIGGSIAFQSTQGKGTKISFSAKINPNQFINT